MGYELILDDVLQINQRNAPASNIILPKNYEAVAVFCGPLSLADIVGGIAFLDLRQFFAPVKSRVSVPESPVNFNKGIRFGQVEIEQEAPDSILLSVGYASLIKKFCHSLFKKVVGFTRSALLNLLDSCKGMGVAGFWITELAAVGLPYLFAGFWGMGTAKHSVCLSEIGSISSLDSESFHPALDCALGDSVMFGYLRLRPTFDIVQSFKFLFCNLVGSISHSLGLAVSSARYAQLGKPPPYGWVCNSKVVGNLGESKIFLPVERV